MNLVIETYPRGEGFLAVVAPEGALLSDGACGGGVTERGAVVEAVNAYFNKGTELCIEPVEAPQPFLLRRQATTPPQVRELVAEVLRSDPGKTLLLSYEDNSGRVTHREVVVSKIEDRRARSGFPEGYLIAIDLSKDEPRTFRLDRIKHLSTA